MLKPFWFRKPPNYGDILTPYILSRLGIRYQFAHYKTCDSLFVGSIAKLARKGVGVYGSGFIRASDPVATDADWHFVRGPLTREMVLKSGGKCPEIYGDLGLLMPQFIKQAAKEHDIGYIPHGVDYDTFPSDAPRVKLYHPDVIETTRRIAKCRKVISSSLHGIIVAHAYGIPAAYVRVSDKLSGDGMKFTDYYRSVGLEPVLSSIESPVFQLPANIDMSEPLRIMKELI